MKPILAGLVFCAAMSAQLTDHVTHAEPALPPLPAAGAHFQEPTFGTSIIRITGESDGQYCYHAYSYWPVFNSDNTRLLYYCAGNGARIAQFDPATWTVTKRAARLGGSDWQAAIWSPVAPNIIYATSYTALRQIDENKGSYSTLLDLAGTGHPHRWMWQIHMSEDEDTFSFSLKDSTSYALVGYAVYRKSTSQYLIYQEGVSNLDEVQIDKTGHWLLVKSGVNPRNVIINLDTQETVSLNDNTPDFATGHSDAGSGLYVGWDYTGPVRLINRSFATPHTFVSMGAFASSGHVSLLSTDETYVTTSTGVVGTVDTPYENEILKVKLDGSGDVLRYAHHRSVPAAAGSNSYWANPMACVSRNGQFIAFNSTWGNNNRIDVFVVTAGQAKPVVRGQVKGRLFR